MALSIQPQNSVKNQKIEALEGKVGKYDKQLQEVIGAIRMMFAPPNPEDRKIKGFGK